MLLNIGKDFSLDPAGRFRTDGDASGEAFREDFLLPNLKKLKDGEKLTIVIDEGVEGYGSSFLTEGFAGIVKYGYMKPEILCSRIEIKFSEEDFSFYKDKIYQYISEAKYNSKKYLPN